jgi:hypothetical protein|tara:strand:+ start:933 stop:2891 length:1959 start_codon:yes stop_codon:yes gene_type:complete
MDNNIHIVELATYEKPEVIESNNKDWIEYGIKNDYYDWIIERYKNSTTNNAVINNVAKLIYGRGLHALDASRKPNEYAMMKAMISGDVLRGIALNFKMLGAGYFQIIYNKQHTKIVKVDYIPTRLIRVGKCNEEGVIDTYYYSDDWENVRKYPPVKYSAFGTSKDPIEIDCVKLISVDKKYYTDVDYHGGLPYAVLEESISEFQINDVNNSFSGSKVINFNNGVPSDEEQRAISRQVKGKLTGAKGDRVIVAFNSNQESKTTIDDIALSDAPEHYAYLSNEAQAKLLNAHQIVSPMLVGITNENHGFSSNADEIEMAVKVFYNQSIKTFQDAIIEKVNSYLAFNNCALNLYFKRLDLMESVQEMAITADAENVAATAMNGAQISSLVSIVQAVGEGTLTPESGVQVIQAGFPTINEERARAIVGIKEDGNVDPAVTLNSDKELFKAISELGEEESEDWILIDERPVDLATEEFYNNQVREWEAELQKKNQTTLSKVLKFATGRAAPNKPSEQDKEVNGFYFKVRYVYAGNPSPQRKFCKEMMRAQKLYRLEDINKLSSMNPNPGFGEGGSANYDLFTWKGGVRCKHYFNRRVYVAASEKENISSYNTVEITREEARRFGYVPPKNDYLAGIETNKLPRKGYSPNNPNLPSDV